MFRCVVKVLCVVLLEQMLSAAYANSDKPPQTFPNVGSWSGTNASAGAVMNTGNSNSQTYNFGMGIDYTIERWQHQLDSTFQRASSQKDGVTAQKLTLLGQSQYNFDNYNFVSGQVNYTNDKFDGYVYVLNEILLGGHRLLSNHEFVLDVQAGPGLQEFKKQDDGGTKTIPSVTMGSTFIWTISKATYLKELLQVTSSSQNTRLTSDLSLSTTLTDSVGFRATVSVAHDSKPLDDKKSINTTTSMQLVYTF